MIIILVNHGIYNLLFITIIFFITNNINNNGTYDHYHHKFRVEWPMGFLREESNLGTWSYGDGRDRGARGPARAGGEPWGSRPGPSYWIHRDVDDIDDWLVVWLP